MKRNKNEILKAFVDSEEGCYECPECGGLNYLDSFELTYFHNKGNNKMIVHCPMCETKLKLINHGSNYYPEL